MSLSRWVAAAGAVILGLAGASPAAAPTGPDSYWVYFGTYTDKAGSQGIYRSKFDAKAGKLAAPELAAEQGSPSFLAVHPSRKFLYAVGEGGGKEGGPVVAYAVDPATGALTRQNQLLSGGSGPCHVSVDGSGKFAVVANYGGGSCAAFSIGADGKLQARTAFIQHKGSSVDKGRQEAPHAHCGFFDAAGKYALVADLGLDQVLVYALDRASGGLTPAQAIKLPAGAGPRHIAISPANDFAYVCGELNSTVNVIRLDLAGNASEVVQSLSTLPHPVKGNSTAECVLHPSGKFVYVSNRGHNTIAVFKVGADHKLTAAGHVSGAIKVPRNFNIDPSGRWMLVASQDGERVGVFELDPETGLGRETGESVKVSKPVCVKFVPAAP